LPDDENVADLVDGVALLRSRMVWALRRKVGFSPCINASFKTWHSVSAAATKKKLIKWNLGLR
jgi:hypothetical protein